MTALNIPDAVLRLAEQQALFLRIIDKEVQQWAPSLERLNEQAVQFAELGLRAQQYSDVLTPEFVRIADEATLMAEKLAEKLAFPAEDFEALVRSVVQYVEHVERSLGATALASMNRLPDLNAVWTSIRPAIDEMMIAGAAKPADVTKPAALGEDGGQEAHAIQHEGDRSEDAHFALTAWHSYVLAWLLTIAIYVLTRGSGVVVEEQLRQDLHTFAVGVMATLTVLSLKPPNAN